MIIEQREWCECIVHAALFHCSIRVLRDEEGEIYRIKGKKIGLNTFYMS